MNILILGGDGYIGWPLAMKLSRAGYNVGVVDNYLRLKLSQETGNEPLLDSIDLKQRTDLWSRYCGFNIRTYIGDLRDWSFISNVFRETTPQTIVHLAEIPSAPYSMISRSTATLTLQNNLEVTANVIFAIKEFCPDAHLVKLGTMGEYGTPNIDIEEGWLNVKHKGREHTFLYPRQAGSMYHTTKVMDTDLLWFYVRTWELRVTDLMQGPVYGVFTDENRKHEELLPHFNYDEIFGTVINRFIVQAVAGYPLTVYGRGGQTRGYLDLRDSLNSIKLVIETPPKAGELRIFNQFVETFTVSQLATMIKDAANELGLSVQIKPIDNPRKELEEHYYNPRHTGLLDLGLKPHYMSSSSLIEMIEWVTLHKSLIVSSRIFKGIKWN